MGSYLNSAALCRSALSSFSTQCLSIIQSQKYSFQTDFFHQMSLWRFYLEGFIHFSFIRCLFISLPF